jgi:hypothetical protein
MHALRLASLATAALVVAGCTDHGSVLGPSSAAPSSRGAAHGLSAAHSGPIETVGHFDAHVDFSTLTLTPRGENCLLTVKGQLVFSGTIEGTGTGQTSALVFGPCDVVATTPPGTFPDRFVSVQVFDGTIGGQPAHSDLLYMGYTAQGGHIDGRLIFSNGVAGRLTASAQVAVGGDYSGSIVVP